jgi:hypothetical protein
MSIKAIETTYAGYKFRSRLEARWAVFFDEFAIPWRYEVEGFIIEGRRYLPDFLLPECGTWIEVKGAEHALDKPFLRTASIYLPKYPPLREPGPTLMVLGDLPRPIPEGDYGWLSLNDGDEERCGFGTYHKNKRPWYHANGGDGLTWLNPTIDEFEWNDAQEHYLTARMARFEHGQSGA